MKSHQGKKVFWGRRRGKGQQEEQVAAAAVLARRGKQIDYMKNDRFLELVGRKGRAGEMLRTPNKRRKYGRRQWDRLVRD
jgi:hypothetical protein